tara:strand:+ start:1254 stop:1511 length:258 start_codon:yes stop_codon:yes gene_type:complete
MENNQEPSKFKVKSTATEDEIWMKILETLNQEERNSADRSISIIYSPYEGGTEITVKRTDQSIIAFASISEIRTDEIHWSVYKES